MLQTISDFILNRQWSIVVGLAATGLAFGLSEYADAVPVELAPVLAALVTWLRVWSNASVDEAVAEAAQVDDPVT